MSILFIGPDEETAIKASIAAARKNVTPWDVFKDLLGAIDKPTEVLLRDRKPGVKDARKKYPPQQTMLGTYRCALSFEEQPAGLFRHLSVSTRMGKVPGPQVMEMVCRAYGFDDKLCRALGQPEAMIFEPVRPAHVWVEEFEPGWFAVNVTELEA